jgi:ribosome biogenesis GTPase
MTAAATDSPLVVTTFGRRFELALPSGGRVPAKVKGRRLRPVCGDRVVAHPIDNEDDWLITDIEARRNELSRPDSRGRVEVLAANVSLLVVVVAKLPKPDWFIVDRYLSAAELMPTEAIVAWNKIDLADAGDGDEALADYARIGYPVIRTSADSGKGLDQLGRRLSGETAIVVGQSGVGKSSLVNALLGDSGQRVAEISEKSGEGRHTTVNSALIALPGGGAVIDSPGVRDYAPAIDAPERVVSGFREIEAEGRACRYANCRHLREPGCAVKAAVEDGRIAGRRYESYKRLLHLTEGFAKKY